mgnify:CR=1 FL=1
MLFLGDIMDKAIIKTVNLCKSFDTKVIFENVNLTFNRGECTAVLGGNGSGKSTFIRMLSGLCRISKGEVIKDKSLKFNYIPENYSKISLTTDSYLKCMGEIEKIEKKSLSDRISYLYSRFKFQELKDTAMKDLSKGSLQKAAIMQAFLSKADVLLLDEPMTGLDVDSQRVFIEEVKKLIEEGTTVIMSCHEAFLVSSLCTRVLEIKDNNIVESTIDKYEEKTRLIFRKKENCEEEVLDIIKDYGNYFIKDNKLNLEIISSKSNEVLFEMLKRGYILEKFI